MNNVYNHKKFKSFTRYLNIAMKVLFWCCSAAAVIGIIASTIIAFVPSQYFMYTQNGNSFLAITMDDVMSYKLQLQGTVNIKSTILSIVLGASLITSLMSVIVKQISLILSTIQTDTPFSLKNAGRISLIGYIMIAGAFIIRAVEFVVFHTIINSHSLHDVHLSYKPNVSTMLVGMLLLVLAGVFRHGSYLQQEYDTTI